MDLCTRTSGPRSESIFKLVPAATGGNGCLVSLGSRIRAEKAASALAPKVLFAAGGTGGHVFPAISIAGKLQELHPGVQIDFVGTKNRMEWTEVPRAGYRIEAIPATGLRRPLWSMHNALVPVKLAVSLLASWQIISKLQPHVVVGTGGYVSGPLCLVAALRGCPVVLQEQNAHPGITNTILARFARLVFVAFPAAIASFPKARCVLSGNPTRLTLDRYISSSVSRRLFFPDMQMSSHRETDGQRQRAQVVLVLGGSLGAKSMNQWMQEIVPDMLERHPRRYVIWQTGSQYYEDMKSSVLKHPRLALHGFINSMETAYAAADLVVSRSGAVTCSEILTFGKPSILLPSPNVTDDHQTKNARSLQQAGAARMLAHNKSSAPLLSDTIDELLGNQSLLQEMGDKALGLATPDAASNIAKAVLDIATREMIQ